MAVESKWLNNNEGKIIVQRFSGTLTPEDMQQASADIAQKARNAKGRRLHFIVDVSDVQDVNIANTPNFTPDMQRIQPGWMVMVGENANTLSDQQNRRTTSALNQLLSFRSRQFNTLEEGAAFLEDISELLGD